MGEGMILLALFAHPDDETLACGGLIARDPSVWHVAVLADGVTSRGGTDHATRAVHFRAAMQVFGVPPERYEAHGLPDQRLDTVDFLDLAKGVTQIIDRVHPDAVYTHHRGDLNMDHRLVCEAVHVACRPPQSPAIYECETPSTTEWGIREPFRPNVFVHLTLEQAQLAADAFACYRDEVRLYPYPRSARGLFSRFQYWGQQAGVEYAQPFTLCREVR